MAAACRVLAMPRCVQGSTRCDRRILLLPQAIIRNNSAQEEFTSRLTVHEEMPIVAKKTPKVLLWAFLCCVVAANALVLLTAQDAEAAWCVAECSPWEEDIYCYAPQGYNCYAGDLYCTGYVSCPSGWCSQPRYCEQPMPQ